MIVASIPQLHGVIHTYLSAYSASLSTQLTDWNSTYQTVNRFAGTLDRKASGVTHVQLLIIITIHFLQCRLTLRLVNNELLSCELTHTIAIHCSILSRTGRDHITPTAYACMG